MLIMDQRTMQIKYRIPASEIIRLSLSPYFDDIAVFHVKAVSYASFIYFILYTELFKTFLIAHIQDFIIMRAILDLGKSVTRSPKSSQHSRLLIL